MPKHVTGLVAACVCARLRADASFHLAEVVRQMSRPGKLRIEDVVLKKGSNLRPAVLYSPAPECAGHPQVSVS